MAGPGRPPAVRGPVPVPVVAGLGVGKTRIPGSQGKQLGREGCRVLVGEGSLEGWDSG